jgi:23S rRNA pseudouridine1911/1915/1917 synthase
MFLQTFMPHPRFRPMPDIKEFTAIVPSDLAGRRLDQAMSSMFPDFSRSRLKQWILGGQALVDGSQRKPRDKVLGGETICVRAGPEKQQDDAPEDIDLDIVFEDASIIVVNKPVGLVVHPGAGNPRGTLMNALLHHRSGQADLPRAGIVHRLDKGTSGLMVVACTLKAHTDLVRQIERRDVHREYQAVCQGVLTAGGLVDQPIGRHPVDRLRMTVRADGKEARTHYRVVKRYRAHTHMLAKLETGRTHQIRVHMAHIRHPLLGDPVYGGRRKIPAGATEALKDMMATFRRQALHACRLGFVHPDSGESAEFRVPPPPDMRQLLDVLKADLKAGETA